MKTESNPKVVHLPRRREAGIDLELAAGVRAEARTMSVFCRAHPLAVLRPLLRRRGVVAAGELRRLPSGKWVKVSGLRLIVHTPPTRSGRRVMFVTMEDETGLLDLVIFPRVQEHAARHVLTSEVLTVHGRLQRDGARGRSVSIVVEGVVPTLCGGLLDLLPEA